LAIIRQGEHWWHDAFFLFKECEKHGARPWVWSDYYWHNPELFKKNMPKSVLQSNWYYHKFTGTLPERYQTAINTYAELDQLGFEQVPTASTWSEPTGPNHQGTLEFCREKLSPELLKGYMTVPWARTRRYSEFYLKNDAYMLYEARKMYYPETLEK
jgi:hypothetical protein